MAERTLICPECSLVFATTHPRAICCSRPCTTRRNNRIQAHKRSPGLRRITCVQCGRIFAVHRSDTMYCSAFCRGQATYLRTHPPTVHELTCQHCGKTFEWHNLRPAYCSRECRRRVAYDRFAEERRQYSREWNKANKDTPQYRLMMSMKYHRRRAAKARAGGVGISVADWAKVLRRAQGRCAYCLGMSQKLTLDHVVPLSRGGQNAIGNALPACQRCNFSKGALLLVEWRMRLARRAAA